MNFPLVLQSITTVFSGTTWGQAKFYTPNQEWDTDKEYICSPACLLHYRRSSPSAVNLDPAFQANLYTIKQQCMCHSMYKNYMKIQAIPPFLQELFAKRNFVVVTHYNMVE